MNMNPYWLGVHRCYTLSKYGMTPLSLGWATEFADAGIAVNCLWPAAREAARRPAQRSPRRLRAAIASSSGLVYTLPATGNGNGILAE
jgi:NAD(P)-dependent dehydrogenase (short-subunit alcohol dehydrogenase family)